MKSYNWIEKAKKIKKIDSDYAIALEIGITRQMISRIKKGDFYLSEKVILKIGKILKINPLVIQASENASKSKDLDDKKEWLALSKKASNDGAIPIMLSWIINSIFFKNLSYTPTFFKYT